VIVSDKQYFKVIDNQKWRMFKNYTYALKYFLLKPWTCVVVTAKKVYRDRSLTLIHFKVILANY